MNLEQYEFLGFLYKLLHTKAYFLMSFTILENCVVQVLTVRDGRAEKIIHCEKDFS